jgi:hypothetical protein
MIRRIARYGISGVIVAFLVSGLGGRVRPLAVAYYDRLFVHPAKVVSTVAACREVSQLTALTVHRKATAAALNRRFAFPRELRVSNQREVQHVATTLCTLPARVSGEVYHCPPAGPDIVYSLQFYRGTQPFPAITLPMGGCGNVTGLGRRARFATPSLWNILGQAVGVPHGGQSAFAGQS